MIQHQQVAGNNGGSDRAADVFCQGQPPFPLHLSIEVVADQSIRSEVDIYTLTIGGGRRSGWTADVVKLFDLGRSHGTTPESFSSALIEAQSGELVGRAIELREEDAPIRNDRRRDSRSNGSFPKHILIGTKLDRRLTVSDSRGIRPPELRPEKLVPVVGHTGVCKQHEERRDDDQRGSCHTDYTCRQWICA